MSYDELAAGWVWRPIPGCPGRSVLRAGRHVEPEELLGRAVAAVLQRSAAALDPVLVVPLEGGGLISYRQTDGRWVHTLNTPEGFARKRRELGL